MSDWKYCGLVDPDIGRSVQLRLADIDDRQPVFYAKYIGHGYYKQGGDMPVRIRTSAMEWRYDKRKK